MSGRLQVANTCGIRYTEYMKETPSRNGANMIELKAQELVDNEYIYCDRCGLLTHEDEMRHAYCHNGYESWGEPIYSECEQCADAEWELHHRAYGRGGR